MKLNWYKSAKDIQEDLDSYYNVGHNSFGSIWAMRGNDVFVSDEARNHDELRYWYPDIDMSISGRIDHQSKQISVAWMYPQDAQKVQYVESVLRMDYPGYHFIHFGPKSGLWQGDNSRV